MPLDSIGLKYLEASVPEYSQFELADCRVGLYCGFPFMYPAFHKLKRVYRADVAEAPRFSSITTLKKVSEETLPDTAKRAKTAITRKMFFQYSLPDHGNIYLVPAPQCAVSDWSWPSTAIEALKWNGRRNYFLYLTKGTMDANAIQEFWIELKCAEVCADHCIEIGLAGQYLHDENQFVDEFEAKHPPWTSTFFWLVDYQTHLF